MYFKGIADPSAFKGTTTNRSQCVTVGTAERGGLHFSADPPMAGSVPFWLGQELGETKVASLLALME